MKDNKGLRWNNRREEAVLCEPSDRQHKIDWWFCCIKNWWFESALSGSDLSFPHFASQSSSLVVPISAPQSSVNPPTGNTRPTDGAFDQSVVSDRPSGCSQFHASPLLCCGASQTKVKKWLWGAGGCLDYQRDYRAVQIIVRPGNISKWPSVFGKPSGL